MTIILINFIILFSNLVLISEANNLTSKSSSLKDDRVVSWNFGSFIHPENLSIQFDLKFFSPTQPGAYPVIIFFTGFDGLVPAFVYVDMSTKLAIETNSILVAFDRLRPPSKPDKEELLFEKTLNWTLNNLNTFFNNKNTPDLIRDLVFPDLKSQGTLILKIHFINQII